MGRDTRAAHVRVRAQVAGESCRQGCVSTALPHRRACGLAPTPLPLCLVRPALVRLSWRTPASTETGTQGDGEVCVGGVGTRDCFRVCLCGTVRCACTPTLAEEEHASAHPPLPHTHRQLRDADGVQVCLSARGWLGGRCTPHPPLASVWRCTFLRQLHSLLLILIPLASTTICLFPSPSSCSMPYTSRTRVCCAPPFSVGILTLDINTHPHTHPVYNPLIELRKAPPIYSSSLFT